MKKLGFSFIPVVGLLGSAFSGYAQIQYVRICDIGPAVGFHQIPGTDVCRNDFTGETRSLPAEARQSIVPYPEGKWVANPQSDCVGRPFKVGTFRSTDFTGNGKSETAPIPLKLQTNEFISKVTMSGGFYDPRLPGRTGLNGMMDGLCLRSTDPTVFEAQPLPPSPINPPYGNRGVPLGCISNSRIVNMPEAYSISSTSAYPQVDIYYLTSIPLNIAGPYVYGKNLVVTTDIGTTSPNPLVYCDNTTGSCVYKPAAGSVTVWACVEAGSNSQGGNAQ